MEIILNIAFASTVISIVLWVSKTNPVLAGFIASLPLSTLVILALSHLRGTETESTYTLAKSIFVGVPVTLLFFVPFLIAEKFKLSFWTCYLTGFALLGVGYFTHKYFVGFLAK